MVVTKSRYDGITWIVDAKLGFLSSRVCVDVDVDVVDKYGRGS